MDAAIERRMGTECAAHHHTMLVPLEQHHVWPLGDSGPDIPENKVTLCSNGHGAVHWLLDLMRKGPVPWQVRRRYGKKVRELAAEGWRRIQEQGI